MKCFLVLALVVAARAESDESEKNQDKRSIESTGSGYDYGSPQLISQHVEVENHVPIIRFQGYPVPVPHPVGVPVHVPVQVPHPVPVHVPVEVPVYKTVTVPVEKPVPVTVEKLFPIEVVRKVPISVPKPYPVPVPVWRTKHIYREVIHPKHHHDW